MQHALIHDRLKDEQGFALVITLLALALLTMIGTASINTTSFELQITGNERMARQRFIVADSGWKQAGPYLNALNAPPDAVNRSLMDYNTVRNFGNGSDGNTNDDFSTVPPPPQDGTISNMNYWYQVVYDSDTPAQGFSSGYRNFQYEVTCNANGQAQVLTRVQKVFQVGY
ncbi:MAG: pilus assembly PilX N-terminal domain-containing protein [Desulfobacterales bacterium]|nr:pilus assembly PilX N-terminal domain-containing protein [Desulfobacterales bacterium]